MSRVHVLRRHHIWSNPRAGTFSFQEIASLEAELKAKTELIERQQALLQEWQAALVAQRDAMVKELERV